MLRSFLPWYFAVLPVRRCLPIFGSTCSGRDIFDRDKDQMITKEELTRMLQWLNFNPTNDDIEKLVKPIEETGTEGFYKLP